MAVASVVWAVLMGAALVGGAGALFLAVRTRRLAAGLLLALLCLAGFGVSLTRYRRSARKEKALQHYYAGLDNKRHGNLEEAERSLREALALDPGNPDAKRELQQVTRPAQAAPSRQTQVQLQPGKGSEPDAGERHPKPFHKPSDVGITDYNIEVALDPAHWGLKATATVALKARTRLDNIEMALSPQFRVDQLLLNGTPASYSHPNDLLSIPTRLDKDQAVTVTVRYARSAHVRVLDGGDVIDPAGIFLRPESRWYPSTGELDFHAPIRVAARVPRGMTVVCAGRLARKDVGPKEVTFHWESKEPVQMICLAAGKYVYGKLNTPTFPVETYLWPKHAKKARAYQAETARILDYYAGQFGPYAYPKVAIAEIPFFPGGYGSTSLLLLTDASFAQKQLPVTFLAHELAHQWWGNRISPAGLGAGWLTEAFAEYSALLYQEHVKPASMRSELKKLTEEYQSIANAGPEEAIADTDPYDQIGRYEGVIYFKGAYVLHTLRGVVGDATFRKILRTFADRYAGGKASIPDFERVASEVSGQDLKWFFDQWLRRRGAPKLRYTVAVSGGQATLTVAQEGEPYRGDMVVQIADRAGKTRRTLKLAGPRSELRFPVHGDISSIDFDPDNWWLKFTPRWVEKL